MLDPVRNFVKVDVSPASAVATTIFMDDGQSKIPVMSEGAYNIVWWNWTDYKDPSDDPNVEIVRVTDNPDTDQLTVVRAQEGTLASAKNISDKQYKIILAPTKKMIDDIRAALEGLQDDVDDLADEIQDAMDAIADLYATKFDNPVGDTSQYVRGDGSLAAFPTNVSDFTNDAGYITSADISGKADKTTQIIAGVGLSGGGDLSANRTLNLANTAVTPGTYTMATVTVDAQGRITSATSGSVGMVNWGDIGGDLSDQTDLYQALVDLQNAIPTNVSQLSNDAGYITGIAWGQITGTLSAQTDLQSALDAKVPTSRTLTAGTGLSGGGTLAADRTFSLANTAVTPGSYTFSSITVDAQGRITAASSGSGISGSGTAGQVAYFTASGTIGSSANLAFDTATNRFAVGSAVQTNIQAAITSTATGNTTLLLKAIASQTANILDVQNNVGTSLFQVNPSTPQVRLNHELAFSPNVDIAGYSNTGFTQKFNNITMYASNADMIFMQGHPSVGGMAFGVRAVIRGAFSSLGDLIIGNSTLGSGWVSSTAPVAGSIKSVGGSGTNITGTDLKFEAGYGTGNATGGGWVRWSTPDVGSSGATAQTVTEKMHLTRTGALGIKNSAAPSTATDFFHVYGTDIVAGNSAPHFQTENGDIVRIYSVGGWGTPTGTLTRTTFDSSSLTLTLADVAERLAALITDLKTGHQLLKA